MKKIFFILFAAALLAACSSGSDNNTSGSNTFSTPSDTTAAAGEQGATIFRVTEEEALQLVSKIPEIEAELRRTFPDTAVHNALVAVQPATTEDPKHYIQLMEMHTERGVTLAHFRIDAETGEIRVMDPLSEGETWITLDKWRELKI